MKKTYRKIEDPPVEMDVAGSQLCHMEEEELNWMRKPKKQRLPDKASRRPQGGRGFQPPGMQGGPPRPVFKVPTSTARGASPSQAAQEASRSSRQQVQRPARAPKPAAQSPFGLPPATAAKEQEPEEQEQPEQREQQNQADKDKSVDAVPSQHPKEEANGGKEERPAYMEDRPLQVADSTDQKLEDNDKSSEAEKKAASTQKPPLAAKKLPPAPADGNQGQDQSGFFNMINGLLSFLQRKQAYTGKPASAMYYDDKKGRYVIAGEEDSDDDEPPPPPPGPVTGGAAKPKEGGDADQPGQDQAKNSESQAQESSGPTSLTPAFGGALANRRGRGRGGPSGQGRGRGRPAARFPQTFDPSQLQQTAMPESLKPEEKDQAAGDKKEEEHAEEANADGPAVDQTEDIQESAALYDTAIDITQYPSPSLNDPANPDGQAILDNLELKESTTIGQVPTGPTSKQGPTPSHQRGRSANLGNVPLPGEDADFMRKQQLKLNQEREQMWHDKYMRQQERIKVLKERVKKYQQELIRCRDENEQTIENFTQLCQDLKFRGMDEVEDLQSQIRGLQDQNQKLGAEKAEAEFRIDNLVYELGEQKAQNSELELSVEKLREQVRADLLQAGSSLASSEQTLSIANQNQGLVGQGQSMSHQGVESGSPTLQVQDEQIRLGLEFGNLSAAQAKERHEQLQKVLDLQCENDRLSWQICSQKQQSNQLLQTMHQIGLKLQDANSCMAKQQEAVTSLRNQLNQQAIEHDQKIMEIENKALESQGLLKQQADKIQKERDEKKMEIVDSQRQISHLQAQLTSLQQQNALLQQQHQNTLNKQRQQQQLQEQMQQQNAGQLMGASSAAGGLTADALRNARQRMRHRAPGVPAQVHGGAGEGELSEFVDDDFSGGRSHDEEEEDDEEEEEEDDVTSSDDEDDEEFEMRSQQEEAGHVQQQQNYGSNTFIDQEEKRTDDRGLGPGALTSDENKLTQTERKQSNESQDKSESSKSPRCIITSPITSIKKRSTAARVQRQIDQKMTDEMPSEEFILNESQKLNKKDEIEFQIREQLRKQSALQKKDKKRRQKRKTMQQILKEQIEESRAQQKTDFEKRLKVEKELHQCTHFLTLHREGVRDIVNVLQGIMKSENIRGEPQLETGRSSRAQTSQQVTSTAAAPSTLQTEDNDEDQQQSSQVRHRDDNQEQEEREGQVENSQEENEDANSGSNVPEENQLEVTVEKAIQRIFEVQRHYQGLTTDLQHKLSVLNLKTESQESLTLDLEILQQEKMLVDQEILNLKSKVNQAHLQTKQVQQRLSQVMEEQARDQVKISASEGEVEALKRQIERETARSDDMRTQMENQSMRRMQEVRDNYEREVIPRIQQQADQRAQQSIARLNEQIATLQSNQDDLQKQKTEHEAQLKSKDEELRQAGDDKKQLQEVIKMKDVEQEELQNQINTLQAQHRQELQRAQSNADGAYGKLEEQKGYVKQMEQQMSDVRRETDQRCQELIEKRDQYKQQAKDLKRQIEEGATSKDKTQQEMEQLEKELQDAKEEAEKLRNGMSELEEQLEKSKNQQKAKEDEVFWTMVQQVNALKKSLQKSESTIKDQELKIQNIQKGNEQKLSDELKAKDDQAEKERQQLESEWQERTDTMKMQHSEELERLREELKSDSKSTKQDGNTAKEAAEEKQTQIDEITELKAQVGQLNEDAAALAKKHEEAMKEKDEELKDLKEKVLEQGIHEQSSKYNQVLVHDLNEKVTKLEADNERKKEEVEELKGIYDYQLSINDDLNGKIEELEKQIKHVEQERADQLKESKKIADNRAKMKQEAVASTVSKETQTDQDRKEIQPEEATPVPISVLQWSDGDKANELQEQKAEPSVEKELSQKIKDLQDELEKAKDQLLEAQYQNETLKVEFERQEDELKENLSNLNKELKQAKEQQASADDQIQSKTEQLQNVEKDLTELKEENQRLNQQLANVSSQKESQETASQPTEQNEKALSPEEWQTKVTQLQQRERAYKDAAERLAETFKEKLKKEKDKAKKLNEQISMLLQQIEELEKEKTQLKQQMEEVVRDQFSMIEQFETSKILSFQIENRDESLINLSNIRKQLEMNLSNIDSKLGGIERDREQLLRNILQCLKNAGIEGVDDVDQMLAAPDDGMLDDTLQKLEELLQNYLEDKRQLSQLLEDNGKLHTANEELENKNYDLRYDLQQSNLQVEQLEHEKQEMHLRMINLENRIQVTDNYMSSTDQGRLVLKLRQQEEETQLIKADLFQKMQMYENELQALRQNQGPASTQKAATPASTTPAQTSPVQEPVPIKLSDSTFQMDKLSKAMPQSNRATDDAYADMSVNKDLQQPQKLSPEELNETRIRPMPANSDGSSHSSPQKSATMQAKPDAATQSRRQTDGKPLRALANAFPGQQKPVQSGLFSSIASFFLTETEMKEQSQLSSGQPHARRDGQGAQPNAPTHPGGEDTEYEYYEYDDELDEGEEAI